MLKKGGFIKILANLIIDDNVLKGALSIKHNNTYKTFIINIDKTTLDNIGENKVTFSVTLENAKNK